MYFNKKYKRTGKLYEGVFKSSHINKDTYLKYIYSYIHLNPAKLIDKNWKENEERNITKLLDYVFLIHIQVLMNIWKKSLGL